MIGELDPDAAGWLFEAELRAGRKAAVEHRRERWEVRAAQWKALELARDVFGEEATASLASYPSRGDYRGLVRLAVPFLDLDHHRLREEDFLSMAGSDTLLTRVPLVFVFDPVPVSRSVRDNLEPASSGRSAEGQAG